MYLLGISNRYIRVQVLAGSSRLGVTGDVLTVASGSGGAAGSHEMRINVIEGATLAQAHDTPASQSGADDGNRTRAISLGS